MRNSDVDLFGPVPNQVLQKTGTRTPVPRGYAAQPGSGPQGMRCLDCRHMRKLEAPSGARSFFKCFLIRERWTSGYATDIKARAPSCEKFQPFLRVARSKKRERTIERDENTLPLTRTRCR